MGKTTAFDAADYLDSEEMMAEYLNQALASGDTDLLLAAIGDVVKARGMDWEMRSDRNHGIKGGA